MFDYIRAKSIDEAVALLNDPHCVSRPLAGGTDVLVQVRHGPPSFQRLVDISRVPEMKIIEQRGDEIYIGAAVTYTEIIESRLLQETATCLVEASRLVGGPAIANAGTLGGNVANAAACADGTPPLVCLDAVAHIRSLNGWRAAPVAELITGPHQTALHRGELITHFTFPILPSSARSVFLKLGRRNAQAIARLNVAAAGGLGADGRINFARVVPGSTLSHLRRFVEVETLLIGEAPSTELCETAGAEAGRVMVEATGRRWSTEYKEIALHGLVACALRRVFHLEN
ncbi:MAG: FAD binding domain-containing protein [Anaerolineae bacterium]|nr:FAD binding domain-containing protein [Thermoflexales bacterium]MDW8407317.1 FAD binding domain-containing protein [Anaerolineae bacterium]